ncbi:MAG: phage holin family protein, partial [Faecalibacillus sp.]
SNVGFRGLIKKVGILILIWIGYQIDIIVQMNMARHMIIIGYLLNEVISVSENLSVLGVVKIDAVYRILDILKSKEKEDK